MRRRKKPVARSWRSTLPFSRAPVATRVYTADQSEISGAGTITRFALYKVRPTTRSITRTGVAGIRKVGMISSLLLTSTPTTSRCRSAGMDRKREGAHGPAAFAGAAAECDGRAGGRFRPLPDAVGPGSGQRDDRPLPGNGPGPTSAGGPPTLLTCVANLKPAIGPNRGLVAPAGLDATIAIPAIRFA